MNKIPRIITLVGIGLMCLAIVLSGFNFSKIIDPYRDTMFGERKEVVLSADGIEELIIDIANGNVNIISTKNDRITITYFDSNFSKHELDAEGPSINLTQKQRNVLFNFDFGFMNKVTVEIPEDLILELNIRNVNGKIDVSNLTVNESSFNTTNGPITLANIHTEDNLTLRTTNGRINMNNVLAALITANTTNGGITADSISAYNINLTSTNGRITGSIIGDIDDFQKEMRTTNGSIRINGTNHGNRLIDSSRRDQKIVIRTTNGNIEFDIR